MKGKLKDLKDPAKPVEGEVRAGNGSEPPSPPDQPEQPGPPIYGSAPQPELPSELVQALISEPDPYLLLGREYARRVKLENVVEQTLAYLKRAMLQAGEAEKEGPPS